MTRKTNIIGTIEISRGRSRLKRSRRFSNARINFRAAASTRQSILHHYWICGYAHRVLFIYFIYLFIYFFWYLLFGFFFWRYIYTGFVRYFHGRIKISKLKNDRNLSRARQLSRRAKGYRAPVYDPVSKRQFQFSFHHNSHRIITMVRFLILNINQ